MHSKKLQQLPTYLFVEIDRLKESYRLSGRQVLDLGIGDPDLGVPKELLDGLITALSKAEHHRYPSGRGLPALLGSIAQWAYNQHGASLETEEMLVTIGSKEAIGHLPLSVVDPGSTVLVPDPSYPVYRSSAVFAGADCFLVPLTEDNGYWPDFDRLDREIPEGARLMFLNYPNNPTSAVAGRDRFIEAIEFCKRHSIILVNDAAYCDITYEHPSDPLFPLAREAGIPYIELFSFSKTFSITGWRVGFAVGSSEVISSLQQIKSNLDSGVFGAIQEAVGAALVDHYGEITGRIRSVYRERRDILAASLDKSGYSFSVPEATFYFWVSTPDKEDSMDFCRALLEETGIVATPGIGFGERGEGYFRLSITTDTETVREAGRRLEIFRRG